LAALLTSAWLAVAMVLFVLRDAVADAPTVIQVGGAATVTSVLVAATSCLYCSLSVRLGWATSAGLALLTVALAFVTQILVPVLLLALLVVSVERLWRLPT
jgi:hypothetical protein